MCGRGGWGVGEKEVGRGGGSTHLFEQFYFGAQSLDGLVVLAFEIIREACAWTGRRRDVRRGVVESRVWRRTSRVGRCGHKRRVRVEPEGSAGHAVPALETVNFCFGVLRLKVTSSAHLWVMVHKRLREIIHLNQTNSVTCRRFCPTWHKAKLIYHPAANHHVHTKYTHFWVVGADLNLTNKYK